ncbi:hypothetical protein ABB02_01889 [Clostridiaceae bacterium JG1575]|nr:hypothetical protein ABB02_01889 [Clostridiaceae bacterium JG1575]
MIFLGKASVNDKKLLGEGPGLLFYEIKGLIIELD